MLPAARLAHGRGDAVERGADLRRHALRGVDVGREVRAEAEHAVQDQQRDEAHNLFLRHGEDEGERREGHGEDAEAERLDGL